MRIVILLLLISFSGYSQPGFFRSVAHKKTGPTAQNSAATYTDVIYKDGTVHAWMFKPIGYDDNSNDYPAIIFMPGYGEEDSHGTWANVNNSTAGLGYYLSRGASISGSPMWTDTRFLVIVLNNTSGDFGYLHFDAAKAYLDANYRLDTNRIYVTGLSGGAIGCDLIMATSYAEIAGTVPVSGPSFDNATEWTHYDNKGFWQYHGASDATFGRTIGGSLYWANGNFGAWVERTPAPRAHYFYGEAHTSAVWSTGVYNPATRKDDWPSYLLKFSLDTDERATSFVEFAESSEDITDYREARNQVAQMAGGAPKTALEGRLATLLTTINKGGVRYLVSFQHGSIGSITDTYDSYNIMTSFTTSATLSNIVDVTGGSSTVDLIVGSQFAATNRDGNTSANNALRMNAFGLNYKANLAGLRLETGTTNGYMTISGIPTGKSVDIIVHHHHEAGQDDGSAITAESTIWTSVNSSVQTQYSAYNSTDYVLYEGIPEVSNAIDVYMKCNSTREVLVTSYELVIYTP